MPYFSNISQLRLATCDHRLVDLFSEVIKIMDCSILGGHRGKAAQNKYYAEGTSQVEWPYSKHNSIPSLAVDVAPYPIPRNWAPEDFIYLAGVVKAVAYSQDLSIRWGGDWNANDTLMDEKWPDLSHYEISE